MNVGFFNFTRLTDLVVPRVVPEEVSFEFTSRAVYSRGYVTSSRMPRIPKSGIPLEIVLNILELSHLNDNYDPDNELLSSFALVCRSWSFYAQRLLFRHVRLCSQAAYDSFVYAVNRSTSRGRALGDAVVRMDIVLDNNQPGPLAQVSFAQAVSLCPNLRSISLSLYGDSELRNSAVGRPTSDHNVRQATPSFPDNVLRMLRAGPAISHLHFSNWSDHDDFIVQLLDVWPSLKSLSITGKTPHLSPALKRRPSYPGALQQLRMNCQVEPSLDFLEWLLQTTGEAKSLRGIELSREPSSLLLDFLVQHHGEQLHMLALPSCATHKHAHAVIRCRALREFRTERAWALPTVFRHIPDGIRHLAFGIDPTTPLQHVVELVKTKDELETVTINVWRGDCERRLAALKMTCAFRGVELRITRDICIHRALVVSL
ncbi:hypothetical protein J3A83DRAFT_3202799 [Scleroderma citrinum]